MMPELAIFGLVGGGLILVTLVAFLLSIFWVWMLIDALVNEPTPAEKLLWFVVIFFLHILGALIYWFVRRSGGGRRGTVV